MTDYRPYPVLVPYPHGDDHQHDTDPPHEEIRHD